MAEAGKSDKLTSGAAPGAGPTGARDPKPDTTPPTRAQQRNLAPASESGDPDIQRLLAERQTAQMNRDALTADEDAVEAADEALALVDRQLAERGYK